VAGHGLTPERPALGDGNQALVVTLPLVMIGVSLLPRPVIRSDASLERVPNRLAGLSTPFIS